MGWIVYVLTASGHRATYVGITTDLERRLGQHNGELPGGAKSTRRGRPWAVAARHGPFEERAEAQRVERRLKRRRGRARLDPRAALEAQRSIALSASAERSSGTRRSSSSPR